MNEDAGESTFRAMQSGADPSSVAIPTGTSMNNERLLNRAAPLARSSGRQQLDALPLRRLWREETGQAASDAYTSQVFVIVLTQQGQVIDCDGRGEAFLRAGKVLRVAKGYLACSEACWQPRLTAALREAALAGRTTSLLLQTPDCSGRRFSITLTPMQCRLPATSSGALADAADLLCLVAPLDRQRIATARQLIDLFGLSGAEARLARALCHGNSAEEYAKDQGLRLPTVRTQLSAVFKKTGASRQAALVRLIASIPVVRDSS